MTHYAGAMNNAKLIMHPTLEQLVALRDYYARNHQCGNTTAILLGAMANPQAKILFESSASARFFQQECTPPKAVTVTDNSANQFGESTVGMQIPVSFNPSCVAVRQKTLNEQLAGFHGPLLIDNYAMESLLTETVNRMVELETQLGRSKTALVGQADILDQMQGKLASHENYIATLEKIHSETKLQRDLYKKRYEELLAEKNATNAIENGK